MSMARSVTDIDKLREDRDGYRVELSNALDKLIEVQDQNTHMVREYTICYKELLELRDHRDELLCRVDELREERDELRRELTAKLPKSRVDELAQLLKHTSLTQLIQTGRAIGTRMEFLSGLSTILFDRQIKRRLLERRQLHRILAHETWIFGEEWSLTGDDERLTKVLKNFLKKLGTDVELADLKEVRLEDGSDAIPDLVLGRRLQTNADSFEHLVVELKRPKHKLDDDDVSQLRSYASAIVNDEAFAQPNVKWDFWLVGNETTRTVDEQRRQPHLPFGVVQESPYRIVVKQWSELISDAQHRLKFVQNSLEYETSHDSGLAYLREKYAQFLPTDVAESASDEVQSA